MAKLCAGRASAIQEEGWDGEAVRRQGVRNKACELEEGEGKRSPDGRHAARPGWMRLARQ